MYIPHVDAVWIFLTANAKQTGFLTPHTEALSLKFNCMKSNLTPMQFININLDWRTFHKGSQKI